MAVPESVRKWVRQRAENRCEYCYMHQSWEPFHAYHIEHIIALQHRGTDDQENLALACHSCNLHKGPNLSSRDPDGDAVVRIFHPRIDRWEEHFEINNDRIAGISPIGRTTVFLLNMNDEQRLDLRRVNRE